MTRSFYQFILRMHPPAWSFFTRAGSSRMIPFEIWAQFCFGPTSKEFSRNSQLNKTRLRSQRKLCK